SWNAIHLGWPRRSLCTPTTTPRSSPVPETRRAPSSGVPVTGRSAPRGPFHSEDESGLGKLGVFQGGLGLRGLSGAADGGEIDGSSMGFTQHHVQDLAELGHEVV